MSYIMPFISLLNEMAVYLLIGFLVAGVLKVFVPKDIYINKLSKPTFSSVLWSAIAGIPLPLCSCGVIPTAMSLRKEGASKGATVAFLISTPQTGMDGMAAAYSLLGLPFALLRPVVGFLTGLLGGVATNKLDTSSAINDSFIDNCELEYKPKNKLLQVLHYGLVEMIQDIGKWLVIGIILAGLLAIFLPDSFFTSYMHIPILNMLMVMAISVFMYNCATGSIALAAVLMMKGLDPGAALLLLLAGPATNISTIAVIGKVLGKRTLAIYLGSIILGGIIFGLMIDYLLPASWFSMVNMNHDMMHAHHHGAFSWIKMGASIILIGLLINAFLQKHLYSIKLKKLEKMASVYKIGGMTCNHCKANIEKNLTNVNGVTSVVVDLEKAIAYVEGNPSDAEVQKVVDELGYEYKGKE